eukprot:gene37141-9389_t
MPDCIPTPPPLGYFEKVLEREAPDGAFFCGKGLVWTYCDIVVFDMVEQIAASLPGALDAHPRLRRHANA